jgi:hypothetical protein
MSACAGSARPNEHGGNSRELMPAGAPVGAVRIEQMSGQKRKQSRHLKNLLGKRGKSRGSQAVAHRCLMIAGKYGTSGGFGTASREPR